MLNINQAVILAGGKGERLRPHTDYLNKGMVSVAGKPFMHYLISQFAAQGIRKILVLTGYLGETIENYFGKGVEYGVEISYNFQPPLVNHGKRLELAFSELDEIFLLHKCDIFWPLNLEDHIETYQRLNRPVMMTVYNNKNKDGIYGIRSNIEIERGIVESYVELSDDSRYIGQDIGYVICDRNSLLGRFPPGNFSLHDGGLLGSFAADGLLSGFLTEIQATTITDSGWLVHAEHYMKNWSSSL